MSWVILFFAGVLEIAWAVGLKYTVGFTRLWPSVFTLATMAGAFAKKIGHHFPDDRMNGPEENSVGR